MQGEQQYIFPSLANPLISEHQRGHLEHQELAQLFMLP